MSDFYSVLKRSIVDRGLRSPAAREEVYDQARTAMIRELWSYDPPLAEDEIDARIGAFDRTVERIEGDLVAAFANPPPRPPANARNRKPPPLKPAPVFDGYDDDADYAAAVGGRTASDASARNAEAASRLNADEEEAIEIGRFARRLAPDSLAERSAAVEQALRGEDSEHESAEHEDQDEPQSQADEDYHGYDDERGQDFRDDEVGDRREREAPRDDRSYSYSDRDRRAAPAQPKQNPWIRLSEQSRIRVLVGAITTLVVILIAIGIYIGISVFSSHPGGQAEVPVTPAGTATGAAEEATQVAALSADVAQSFAVFDGRDPTVFESAPDNPIRFDRDSGGSFARVTSSVSDAGARVLLGPGLAARLSGQPVRIIIVARAAHDNGAANMRFAYQSGVALSHWQSANLTADYASFGIIWRVPKQRTDPTGDYLLIEPGIPGDGTAMEIQSIRIDLLAREPG